MTAQAGYRTTPGREGASPQAQRAALRRQVGRRQRDLVHLAKREVGRPEHHMTPAFPRRRISAGAEVDSPLAPTGRPSRSGIASHNHQKQSSVGAKRTPASLAELTIRVDGGAPARHGFRLPSAMPPREQSSVSEAPLMSARAPQGVGPTVSLCAESGSVVQPGAGHTCFVARLSLKRCWVGSGDRLGRERASGEGVAARLPASAGRELVAVQLGEVVGTHHQPPLGLHG